jgi:hypothetical protein
VVTYKTNTLVNLYLFDNSFKEVKVDPSISSVTVMAVCEQSADFAYAGIDSQTSLPSGYIMMDGLKASNRTKIQSGCEVKLITFGTKCDSIGYVCADNTVSVYNIITQTVVFTRYSHKAY